MGICILVSVGLLTTGLTLPIPAESSAVGVQNTPSGQRSLREAIRSDASRFAPLLDRTAQSSTPSRGRNWIQRHPSCFGAAVGFVAGFLIGWLPGDDAVFDDFTGEFNGAVVGGIGAAAGAILGRFIDEPS